MDGEITDVEAATLGAVVTLINADTDGYWHARIVSGFTDSDTSDLLEVTSVAVTENGITSGTGAKNGGICWDVSDLVDDPFVGSIGPEMDTDLPAAARVSASNVRNNRDVLDSGFGSGLAVMETVARLYGYTITAGNGSGSSIYVNVYSAKQSDTRATATLLYTSEALTEDTLLDKTNKFPPPTEIQSKQGERLVLSLLSGTQLDALQCQFMGAYGDPGQID